MDVGIIEKTENLGALILQNLKRINGTGCTADVEEYFQKSTSVADRRHMVHSTCGAEFSRWFLIRLVATWVL
jgi:hypothetical protein